MGCGTVQWGAFDERRKTIPCGAHGSCRKTPAAGWELQRTCPGESKIESGANLAVVRILCQLGGARPLELPPLGALLCRERLARALPDLTMGSGLLAPTSPAQRPHAPSSRSTPFGPSPRIRTA